MARLWTFVVLMWISSVTYGLAQTNGVDPQVKEIKADMISLSQNTQPGSFFPEAQVPVDLNRFRQDMLDIGNLGRRDSEYRTKHGEKVAIDLSGETTKVGDKEEKVYKNNESAPYFNDLVLNDDLNKAAQFQAEYNASIGTMSHEGPANYQERSMVHLIERVDYFNYHKVLEGEGVAAIGLPTDAPEVWMQSNSHFRPWFNVGTDVREVGLGIARGTKEWYAVVISSTGHD